jgi:hypothetical protein
MLFEQCHDIQDQCCALRAEWIRAQEDLLSNPGLSGSAGRPRDLLAFCLALPRVYLLITSE